MITLKQAREAVALEIQQRGDDFLYRDLLSFFERGRYGATAYYFHPVTGRPLCIVGQVLARYGLSFVDIDPLDNCTALPGASSVAPKFEPLARDYLTTIQQQQDVGTAWSVAKRRADELYNY